MITDLRALANALGGEINGGRLLCPGPDHSAADRSLSIKLDSNAPDGFVVHSFAGDDPIICKDYVRAKAGLPAFAPNSNGKRHRASEDAIERALMAVVAKQTHNDGKPKGRIVAPYGYKDADGTLLYQNVRFEPKDFRQRRPDGNGGWIWNLNDVRRVLYRWPELIAYPDATVLICEGEKDADNVAALNLTATTVASGKWTQDCIDALTGRDCWIIQDVDINGAGDKKARSTANHLHGVAKSIKIVRLPGLTGDPGNKDVSNWLEQGHSKDELIELCASTPDWEPGSDAASSDPTPDEDEPAPAKEKPALLKLCFVKIEDWFDREPPQRDWAVPDRFPLRNVSLISGEGSIGKSLVLMQLTAAMVFGKGWLDTLPDRGDAIYLNAEDEADELWRRYADIVRLYDSTLSDLAGHLHLLSMAGKDAVLASVNNTGIVKPTPLFKQLTEAAGDIKPKLIGLDTSADIFAGAENDRAQVRQFIGLLRGLSIIGNSAVIVCAHPSLTGISTGTGLSGSTAWHNSVRARAYMHVVKASDGIEPDKTLRQLEFMKSNYSALGDMITLRWKNGVYVPEAKPGSLEQIAADAKAEGVFLTLLAKIDGQGRAVSHKPTSPYYAPTVFAVDQEAKGVTKRQFAAAMQRLFDDNKIKVENYGKPSRQSARIVPCV
jgi:RecA-family ATPase